MRVVAIAGGTGSGKTTLAQSLSRELTAPVISIDDYYFPQNHRTIEERCQLNFDEPSAIDHEFLLSQLGSLRTGRSIIKPIYDFSTHTRAQASEIIEPAGTVIIEGLFALVWAELREMCDLKIFVETDLQFRFERRVRRDVDERGRDQLEVENRFRSHVNPMHQLHVQPTKAFADLVISGLENPVQNSNKVLKQLETQPIFL